jgi:hypothetical protein
MSNESSDAADHDDVAMVPAPAIPVQHCPFCGESVGSFWGRRGDDGSHWCESCQQFFRVEAV